MPLDTSTRTELALYAAVLIATLAVSALKPWGFALPPAPTACQAAPSGQHATNAATIRRCLAREVMA